LAEYTCLQYAEMAGKLYSPVYSPGQTAKYPKKFYATLAKWRIALPALVLHVVASIHPEFSCSNNLASGEFEIAL
jgi:hypothetical protein